MSTLALPVSYIKQISPQNLYDLITKEAESTPAKKIKITTEQIESREEWEERRVAEARESLKKGYIKNEDMRAWIMSWGTENELPRPKLTLR